MPIPNTFHESTATAPKRTTLIAPSDPERFGQPGVPHVPFDQAPAPNANTSTSLAVQPTAGDLPLPSYSANRAARYEALLRDAQTAGGAVSVDFSGPTISAGGKMTRTVIATQKITENANNSVFTADKGIKELWDAPNIDITHKEVISASLLGSINSKTMASEKATIVMTNTTTAAGENLVIDQRATEILCVNETNTKYRSGNDSEIIRKAEQVIYAIDRQQIPVASRNDKSDDDA